MRLIESFFFFHPLGNFQIEVDGLQKKKEFQFSCLIREQEENYR